MDIALLSKMVGELILNHDQVGLPGVGTFVAELVPASFSDKGYTITPPYRRIVFHPDCLEEDLLCDFYCRANSDVDPRTARRYLTNYFTELKGVLMDRRQITFPGLGRLRTTRDNNIFFIPDEDLDIYPDGVGLEAVSLKTHVKQELDDFELRRPKPVGSVVFPDLEPLEETAVSESAEPVAEAVGAVVPESAESVAEAEETAVSESAEPAAEPAPAPVALARYSSPEASVRAVNRHSMQTSGSEAEVLSGKGGFRWWIIPLSLVLATMLFLAVFVLLSQITPDFIDKFLYNAEELNVINYFK